MDYKDVEYHTREPGSKLHVVNEESQKGRCKAERLQARRRDQLELTDFVQSRNNKGLNHDVNNVYKKGNLKKKC